jgi:hypothetical protein
MLKTLLKYTNVQMYVELNACIEKSLSCLFARIHKLLRLRSRLRQFHLDKIKLDLKRKTLKGIFWRKFVKKGVLEF